MGRTATSSCSALSSYLCRARRHTLICTHAHGTGRQDLSATLQHTCVAFETLGHGAAGTVTVGRRAAVGRRSATGLRQCTVYGAGTVHTYPAPAAPGTLVLPKLWGFKSHVCIREQLASDISHLSIEGALADVLKDVGRGRVQPDLAFAAALVPASATGNVTSLVSPSRLCGTNTSSRSRGMSSSVEALRFSLPGQSAE